MNATVERYSANESIDKFILGEKYAEFKHKFITNDACPYCDLENKLICSPVFPAILDKHADTIVRGKNEHEAGHARLTPGNKNSSWNPLKGNLINILEDLRIERGICKLSTAFQTDLDYLNKHFIGKIQDKLVREGTDTMKPVNEALIALHIRENGFSPYWKMSDKAKQYFDAVKDIFPNWKNADCDTPAGFNEIEKLADEIIAKWQEQQDENGNADDGNDNGNNGNDNADNGNNNAKDKQDKQQNTDKVNGAGNGNRNWMTDDFTDENKIEQEIKQEIQQIIHDSKQIFGKYIPYTNEDTFIHAPEDEISFNKAYNSIRGMIAMMAGSLEQALRSQSRNRISKNRENGNLNMKDLHIIAKNLSNNVFYKTINGISLDTTVSILVDESGSTYDLIPQFKALTIAISEVLERLNIKFEVVGHSTGCSKAITAQERNMFSRYNPLMYIEHKRFNESYKKEKYRLGSINSYNCNLDGEALLETFKRAKEQKSNRHIILVLSDGEPSGCRITSEGEKYLTNVVEFCRNNGTEVYAFGIGTNKPEKFYGKENFIYINKVSKMTSTFFRQFAEIITNGKMKK